MGSTRPHAGPAVRWALPAVSRLTVLVAAAALALSTAAAAQAAAPGAPPACTAPTGPYQRQLEQYLKRPVDGVQSPADCAAIRGFQAGHRISPARGYADLATYRTLLALQARPQPDAAGACPVRPYRVTCVDLTRQLLWVQVARKVRFGPVPIRTGRDSQETRPGWHRIYWRHRDHRSTLYGNAPMPYSQFFDRGQALHGHPGSLYDGGGSAGCVNLSLADAKALWNLLRTGDRIYVWGTKPGTAG